MYMHYISFSDPYETQLVKLDAKFTRLNFVKQIFLGIKLIYANNQSTYSV